MTWRITSRFGQQEDFRDKPHTGYDFAMEKGEPIYSIQKGTVRLVDYKTENVGKGVLVQWEDGKTAIYGHLSKFAESLKDGDTVERGQLIGYAGSTGHSTGNHLHFGLKNEYGEFIDGSPYIQDIQNMDKLIAIKNSDPNDSKFSILNMLKTDEGIVGDYLKMLTTNFIDLF